MAKFCGQCGAELRDTATFCDSCGAKCAVIDTPVAEPIAQKSPTLPVSQQTPVSQKSAGGTSDSKPAKKSKKGLFIAIIAAVLVVAIALTTVFVVLPMFNKKTKDEKGYSVAGKDYITFKSPDTRYYISGVDYLDVNQNNDAMSLKHMGMDPNIRSLWTFVSLGDSAFFASRDSSIKKVTYENPTKYEEYKEHEDYLKENDITLKSVPIYTEWLTLDDLKNQVDENTAAAIVDASSYWQYSNGYIYFTIYPSIEQFSNGNLNEVAYSLMRINVETKTVEKIGNDLSANSFVVHDDWIYFSDIGYRPEKTDYDNYYAQRYLGNDIGIYKMKTDGSEKTKLLAFDFKYNGETIEYNYEYKMYGDELYSNLSVYDGKLYYIDNTDPFNSILYRMNFDGSETEQVATKGTYEYTFDTSTNSLYYVSGSYYINNTDVKDIYKVNLKNLSEEKFANYSRGSDRIQIACADSILYFSSPNQQFGCGFSGSEEKPDFAGIYYDLEADKATAAYRYGIKGEDKTISTPIGEILQEGIIEDYVHYWADYDTSDELFTFYN